MDNADQKADRALERVRTATRKRIHHENETARRSEQSFVPVTGTGRSNARRHRGARAATRTCLAKGLLQGSVDVPAVNNQWDTTSNSHLSSKRVAPSVIIYRKNSVGELNLGGFDCSSGPWETASLAADFGFVAELLLGLEHQEMSDEDESTCPSEATTVEDGTVMADVELPIEVVTFPIVSIPECCNNDASKPVRDASLMLDWEGLLKEAELAPESVPKVAHTILQAMRADCEDLSLQMVGIEALDILASGAAGNAAAIAADGGLETLVNLAHVHKGALNLQEALLRLLRAITICDASSRASVASAGGVKLVLTAMSEHLKSVGVQLAGCRILKELAANNVPIQDEICSLCGLEAVLGAMSTYPSVATMQETGCGVIRNMSLGNAQRQNKIVDLGGLRLVLVALGLHSQEPLVQWAGCWALFCLTHLSVPLRGKVVAGGGLLLVLHAMAAHRSIPKVQEAGCWAIKVLTTADDPNLAFSARVAVVQAMQDHPFNKQLQQAGRAGLQSAGACSTTSRGSNRSQPIQLGDSLTKKRKCSPVWSLPTIPE